jgi:hypothetical protein
MVTWTNFKYRKYVSWAIFCCGFLIIAYGYLRKEKAMKDAVIVIAKVTGFQHPKLDRSEVDVQYLYNGKTINNWFSIHNADSLKVNTKVRLLVSRKHPTESEFIKYIGVEN